MSDACYQFNKNYPRFIGTTKLYTYYKKVKKPTLFTLSFVHAINIIEINLCGFFYLFSIGTKGEYLKCQKAKGCVGQQNLL